MPCMSKNFVCCLSLSQRRLLTIAKQILSSTGIKETRGCDHRSKTYSIKRKVVITFIDNLKAPLSHYNRRKSARQYLPSNVNCSNQNNPHGSVFNKDFKLFTIE